MSFTYRYIIKRDGRLVPFDYNKIMNAILKAGRATEEFSEETAHHLALRVLSLAQNTLSTETPTVEEIQDIVEETLLTSPFKKTAKAYILYRDQHSKLREITQQANLDLIDKYLDRLDWKVKENSNMDYSLQGLNNYISSQISEVYWLNKIYSPEVRAAHLSGDLHLHDLGILSAYCVGWDLQDLLRSGFKGAAGKVESRPAKHFRSALGQIVNFFFTLQGEAAGAQAFSNLDTLLAPFIRYDGLSYTEVKQALQEFVFNINVPTRVGFQCMSEDTQILGQDGWKNYNEVKMGDKIATFNVKKGFIEYLPVNNVFYREYEGVMYNLRNRISDQLISPKHRVVRKKFNVDTYALEEIEDVLKLKSPFIIPIGSNGNVLGDSDMDEDLIRFIAWMVAEGSIDKSGRGSGRIIIYQSQSKSPEHYAEIMDIVRSLGLEYTERTQQGLGNDCHVLRFNAASTRRILSLMGSDKQRGIKFIPDAILNADVEGSRLFLDTYIKADGYDNCKIVTVSKLIKDQLLQVIVNAGYGATVLVRKPDNELSKKDRYIIRVIMHKDTYINKVEPVDYKGVIWCPNTANETVVARRNGKVFITGNTPFTNVTIDLHPPRTLAQQPVIIGGETKDATYSDFQQEIDMFNRAFLEVLTEGDACGRVFTFPIPTYNITADFDWDVPELDGLWAATAKYGIPYFANFVNSDMSPDDARSMCCRLRLDLRKLERRGGGLFGANPLTGSIAVVTINMPRLGYLATNQEDFLQRLAKLMEIARTSLETKRKVLERFTTLGLYPYTKFYLREVFTRFNAYWNNHFSTIGLVGMNEACLNLFGKNIGSPEGQAFALRVLNFMRDRITEFQAETGHLYNLEATPAEGTSYRLARLDKEHYPDILTANSDTEPFYTNSTQLPVNYTDDLFLALDLQDELQTLYTGGTVQHVFLGEAEPHPQSVKHFVKTVCHKYHIPYFTLTPTFSVCPTHGYLRGEVAQCPDCGAVTEIYSRVVGYLRPVNQWNIGKQAEFALRTRFNLEEALC